MPPLKWVAADEEGLVAFLVGEKSFNEDRVRKAVQRINAAKSKSTQGIPSILWSSDIEYEKGFISNTIRHYK